MALLTAALIAGAAMTGLQAVEAGKARRSAEREARKQEVQARNLARRSDVLPDSGADIRLGTGDAAAEEPDTATSVPSVPRRVRPSNSALGGSNVGGLL